MVSEEHFQLAHGLSAVMLNSIFLELLFLVVLRVLLFLACRKYLLRSLYSDLQSLSSDPLSDAPSTPSTSSYSDDFTSSGLPSPATQTKSGKPPKSNGKIHSTIASTVFSLTFMETSMMFFILMLQGISVFSPRSRLMSWRFSLLFLMTTILVAVPMCISLSLAIGVSSKTSTGIFSSSRSYIMGPRILIFLLPVGLYLFSVSRIPLPLALTETDTLTMYLARLVVLGTLILGLLSGFGAISNVWSYIPYFSPSTSDPTDQDVEMAEYSLKTIRNDLRDRRAASERQANARAESGNWLTRMTPTFRGGDGLAQELRGLESLEYEMSRNLESLRTRQEAAISSRTFRGRILNFGHCVFAFYCVQRIISSLVNVLVPSRRASTISQTDLIADYIAQILAPVSHTDHDAVASFAHQLSLALVGLIILLSLRRVLRGVTRALRVTSRNLGASLMMLILAQLMGIYLLSTIVQLRNSFPPSPDAEANLFTTIPKFELFGAIFDWSFLFAAGISGLLRWGSERFNVA